MSRHVMVSYRLDKEKQRQAARGNEYPPAASNGHIDAGESPVVIWDSFDGVLHLKGPGIDYAVEHVESFSVGVVNA